MWWGAYLLELKMCTHINWHSFFLFLYLALIFLPIPHFLFLALCVSRGRDAALCLQLVLVNGLMPRGLCSSSCQPNLRRTRTYSCCQILLSWNRLAHLYSMLPLRSWRCSCCVCVCVCVCVCACMWIVWLPAEVQITRCLWGKQEKGENTWEKGAGTPLKKGCQQRKVHPAVWEASDCCGIIHNQANIPRINMLNTHTHTHRWQGEITLTFALCVYVWMHERRHMGISVPHI